MTPTEPVGQLVDRAQLPPTGDAREFKVLVGRIYDTMSTSWSEWAKPFDEVVEAITERAQDQKASGHPDEIIEVIVVRRAQIRAQVTVEMVSDARPVTAVADGLVRNDQ